MPTHQPNWEPQTITLVDWLLRRLTRIHGGGGLWTKIVLVVSLAYMNSGY